jgi:imidazole glycerol-phosphate synthase subunit HisF
MRLHRIIPVLLYRDACVVRSQKFARHFKLGDPVQQLQRYMAWDVDEVVYLDIGQPGLTESYLLSHLPEISRNCFAPLAVGGNIHSLDDIERHLHAGADRVVLGSKAIIHPDFVDLAAHRFGSQAIIVSVDYRSQALDHSVFCHNGTVATSKNIVAWISELHQRGAGEILLHSIDRDGMGTGYDLELISAISQEVSVPIIACGGASSYQHFVEAVSHGASAAAASNIFGFKETAYQYVKDAMVGADLSVRDSLLGI